MDVTLRDATTDQIFEELKARSHSVLLCGVRMLDADRLEVYRNSSGSFVHLFGLLEQEMTELRCAFLGRDPDRGSDDAMEELGDE